MEQIIIFHYHHENSLIHKMDARIKILSMIVLSISISIASNIYSYIILSIFILLALFFSRLPILSLLKNMKIFLLLIIAIIVFNSIEMVKHPIYNYLPAIEISSIGLIRGLYFAWRLILIIALSTIVTSTMSLITFKNVIEWYLYPIPFIPSTRIATIINMTFVLIPTIFDKYIEMKNAQLSKCIDARKNPIRKLIYISLPLLTGVIRKTDELIYAMESRCYTENRTKAIFKSKFSDWVILILSTSVSISVILFSYFKFQII